MDKQNLNNAIRKGKESCEWNYQPRKFLPENLQADLLKLDTIKATIPGISHDLATFVTTRAKKVFLTLLQSKCDQLKAALALCRKYDLTDKRLPVPPDNDSNESPHDCSNHEVYLNVFHEEALESSTWEDFYKHQWDFLVPVFKFGNFEYRFQFGTPLPVTKYGNGSERGFFGVVKEAFLYAGHLQGFPGVSFSSDSLSGG